MATRATGLALIATIALLAASCARRSQPPEALPADRTSTAAPEDTTRPPTESAGIAKLPIHEAPELQEELVKAGVQGTVTLYDTRTGKLSCTDVEKCGRQYVPASIFKIPNAIIGLETGVVSGPDEVFPWDGIERQLDQWNQDLTFREALRLSCVPCFTVVAQRVGKQRMQAWVDKLDYGNRDTTGWPRFWLEGALRITPLQAVDFLYRFETGALPIRDQTRESVVDMMLVEQRDPKVLLRGKTGGSTEPIPVTWFVGWVERPERRVFFAFLFDGVVERFPVDDRPRTPFQRLHEARVQVPQRVLHRMGVWPSRKHDELPH